MATPFSVKVYFGQGIQFFESGDTLSDGTISQGLTAEVESIEGVMEFEDGKSALIWAEDLCNTMGAYLIPNFYTGKIIGLANAIEKFKSSLTI